MPRSCEDTAVVFNIQRYSLQDGPGIRSTVFLKGCPLRCLWCANPESQRAHPEVVHRNTLCTRCGRCLPACPYGAITLRRQGVAIDRRRCTNCGLCIPVCSPGALHRYGERLTVDAVFEEVMRDALFYRNSGGGVTVSGGEPLQRPGFVAALFRRCREANVPTCLDTSGHAGAATWQIVLPLVDLVLCDVKCMDDALHRQVTGVSNRQILESARRIAAQGIPIVLRVPLIPGINDGEDNLAATARFALSLAGPTRIDLLPYHQLGTGKYGMLDRRYRLHSITVPTAEQNRRAQEIVASLGMECRLVL